jgi:hypothetical protein
MKTTATTEAVSSSPEENELWSQQWRQNTSHAGQKPRADWKNVLQIPGAGRKSRKPPTPFVGYKLNGKSKNIWNKCHIWSRLTKKEGMLKKLAQRATTIDVG